MQPAGSRNQVVARPDMQVVGVGEDDLRVEVEHLGQRDALDRRAGADGHERRRLDHAVGGRQTPSASRSAAACDLERHRRTH